MAQDHPPTPSSQHQPSTGESLPDEVCCLTCGYSLTGLTTGNPCPECGETQTDILEFTERLKALTEHPGDVIGIHLVIVLILIVGISAVHAYLGIVGAVLFSIIHFIPLLVGSLRPMGTLVDKAKCMIWAATMWWIGAPIAVFLTTWIAYISFDRANVHISLPATAMGGFLIVSTQPLSFLFWRIHWKRVHRRYSITDTTLRPSRVRMALILYMLFQTPITAIGGLIVIQGLIT